MPPTPRCVICHDDLNDINKPHSTACGHLCCEDCTTFHFSFDRETPCPFCRHPIKREQLFRLYFDFNEDIEAPEYIADSRERRALAGSVQGVTAACRQAMGGSEPFDRDHVSAKVEAAGDLLETLQGSALDLRPLLNSLGNVLTGVRAKLQQLVEERDTEAHQNTITRLEAKYQHKLKKARGESERAKRVLQETMDASQRTQTEMHVKLRSVRNELEQSVRTSEEQEAQLASLTSEMDTLRMSALKYKKKYYLLKQAIRDMKRKTKHENEDDSLMIME